MKPTSQEIFEVRCHRCEVSYPVGTKRCMYCGEKPSAGPPQVDLLDLHQVEEHAGTVVAERTHPGIALPGGAPPREAPPRDAAAEDEAEPEEITLRQALPRVLMSLVWVVLLVVVSVYRACTS